MTMAFSLRLDTPSKRVGGGSYRGQQSPEYAVRHADGAIEVREYGPYVVAEFEVNGARAPAARCGVLALSRYLKGANSARVRLSPTAPVTQTPGARIAVTSPLEQTQAAGRWMVRMMMPDAMRPDQLPSPIAESIRLTTVKPGLRVVLSFAGRSTCPVLGERERDLRSYARDANLIVTGPIEIAYFDDPLTLPWRRHNEISLPVE